MGELHTYRKLAKRWCLIAAIWLAAVCLQLFRGYTWDAALVVQCVCVLASFSATIVYVRRYLKARIEALP